MKLKPYARTQPATEHCSEYAPDPRQTQRIHPFMFRFTIIWERIIPIIQAKLTERIGIIKEEVEPGLA